MNELMNEVDAMVLEAIREYADEMGTTTAEIAVEGDYLPTMVVEGRGRWHLDGCRRVRGDLIATYSFSGR